METINKPYKENKFFNFHLLEESAYSSLSDEVEEYFEHLPCEMRSLIKSGMVD